ncbi:unnamed protein product [Clonostachys rhizophaga]|uniref:Uncharacterized protein n=1 Tax=Clonostachys rhizophaga TaxID=160324 RepID=A0A9N9VJ62_9HYPO|nr:unnamed protein product [Clonostachys rhizophaga]
MLYSKTFTAAILGWFGTAVADVTLIDPNTRFSNLSLSLPPSSEIVLQSSFSTPPDCGETSYVGTGRLSGMKALITGGDSGIGRAIVIAYLREGAHVAINYLPEEESDAQALADFLEPEGLTFERIPGNLLNETFCTELVNEAHRRLDGLDVLINHTGVSGIISGPNYRPIEKMDTAELDRVFKINLYAPLFLTRAAVPLLPPGGSILFTTSDLAENPSSTTLIYSATKATNAHYVRALALQLATKGIRVNGVAPAITYTPFLAAGGFDTETMLAIGALNPNGRVEQPVELSPLYVDLVEPSKTFVSGEIYSAVGANIAL